jgi:ribosome biogenesis protein MAK21
VYKNPKKIKRTDEDLDDDTGVGMRGPSAMQPASSGVEGVKLVKGEVTTGRVNDEDFLRRGEAGNIPVDQVRHHRVRRDERCVFNINCRCSTGITSRGRASVKPVLRKGK